jgi:hypothetical protein
MRLSVLRGSYSDAVTVGEALPNTDSSANRSHGADTRSFDHEDTKSLKGVLGAEKHGTISIARKARLRVLRAFVVK